MARTVTDLLPEEIPEVSRFLVEGFKAPPDATFAAPDVLHWKYFDPRGGPEVPPSGWGHRYGSSTRRAQRMPARTRPLGGEGRPEGRGSLPGQTPGPVSGNAL